MNKIGFRTVASLLFVAGACALCFGSSTASATDMSCEEKLEKCQKKEEKCEREKKECKEHQCDFIDVCVVALEDCVTSATNPNNGQINPNKLRDCIATVQSVCAFEQNQCHDDQHSDY